MVLFLNILLILIEIILYNIIYTCTCICVCVCVFVYFQRQSEVENDMNEREAKQAADKRAQRWVQKKKSIHGSSQPGAPLSLIPYLFLSLSYTLLEWKSWRSCESLSLTGAVRRKPSTSTTTLDICMSGIVQKNTTLLLIGRTVI